MISEQQAETLGTFCLWGSLGGLFGKFCRDKVTQALGHCRPTSVPRAIVLGDIYIYKRSQVIP